MAVERCVWANEISIFSFIEISALLTYGNREFARTQISLRNDLQIAFVCRHLQLKYVYRCQAHVALNVSAQYFANTEVAVRMWQAWCKWCGSLI